jgi:hypothetical protein
MSEEPSRLSLSVKGLQRLEQVNHQRDFAFIVGDERYPCPSFVAEFLSPRITSLRSQDITIDEFSIETEDPHHSFDTLLSIGFGHEVSISAAELKFVRSICGEFWNSELFEMTLKREEGEIRDDELKARMAFLSGVNGSCGCDISIIASHFHRFWVSDFDGLSLSILETILRDSDLVLQDEDSLFEIICRRASEDSAYFGLLEFVRFEFVSADCMRRVFDFISASFESLTFGIWSSLRTRFTLPVEPPSQPGRFHLNPVIDSTIISSLPDIFSVFGTKKFQLLYRGSRDGFGSSAFHNQCNGHPNTITLVSSTNDCILGGYTPVAWNSRQNYAPDPSLTSFLFTIKNPHNLPAQIFKKKGQKCAIYDDSSYGPTFGNHALQIHDPREGPGYTYSHFEYGYTNETGIAHDQVLTGSLYFTVKEVEVFEVT